jgi:hypothetical protein
LILEGNLFAPWITDLGTAFEKFRANFQNREPVIGLKNLTAISQEGEYVLLEVDDGGVNSVAACYQTCLEHCHCHPAIKRDMVIEYPNEPRTLNPLLRSPHASTHQ